MKTKTGKYIADFEITKNPNKVTPDEKKLILFYDKVYQAIQKCLYQNLATNARFKPQTSETLNSFFSFHDKMFEYDTELLGFDYKNSPILRVPIDDNRNFTKIWKHGNVTYKWNNLTCQDISGRDCFYKITLDSIIFGDPFGFKMLYKLTELVFFVY